MRVIDLALFGGGEGIGMRDDDGNDFGLFMVAWPGAVIVVLFLMWLIVSIAYRL